MNSLRPCKVRINGDYVNGYFHRWYEPQPSEQPLDFGTWAYCPQTSLSGVIELDNGQVVLVLAELIQFTDRTEQGER